MASLPPLWVYKCNANDRNPRIARGDWLEFFTIYDGGEWGGSTTMASHTSLDILWNRMSPGDLVLAWQTNRRRAVGLCTVERFDDWVDDDGREQRDMILQSVGEPFSPPVPLLDLRRTNPQLASVRCFQQGKVSTLYETSASEERMLLRACGISLTALAQTGSPQSSARRQHGAGFGVAAENKRVEEAAVRAFKRRYRDWKVEDLQKDNMGYDFCVRRGDEKRHVEVKGVGGAQPSFLATRNEVEKAKNDPLWRVCVVTNALSTTPTFREWTAKDFRAGFELTESTTYLARLR